MRLGWNIAHVNIFWKYYQPQLDNNLIVKTLICIKSSKIIYIEDANLDGSTANVIRCIFAIINVHVSFQSDAYIVSIIQANLYCSLRKFQAKSYNATISTLFFSFHGENVNFSIKKHLNKYKSMANKSI